MIKINKTPLANGVVIRCENDYRSDPIYSQIKNDFFEKCYICEDKKATSLAIEHLISHEGNITLKYDYNNLFYSCSHCNQGKKTQFNNIINCTVEDPEQSLYLEMKPYPKQFVEVKAKNLNVKTLITVELLKKVYNAENTPNMLAEAEHLRRKILDELNRFITKLEDYYDEEEPGMKEDYKKAIRRSISRHATFSAFKREIIRNTASYQNDFGLLLD